MKPCIEEEYILCTCIGFLAQRCALPYYWEESIETLSRGRIYIVVVHLGIGFLARRKNVSMGLIRKLQFFVKIELIFRARSPILLGEIKCFSALDLLENTIGRNQMKPCIEEEYIS